MITRRSLLRLTAATSVAAVAAPLAAGRALTATVPWEALRAQLAGELVTPSDPAYQVARQNSYRQFDDIRPAAIAYCHTDSDVSACVRFARAMGIAATPRSAGHSAGGYSLSDGLVVDVSRLAAVVRKPGTVTVGAGVQQVDLLEALAPMGIALPSGFYPTVGAAGYLQGGGIGWETRQFGVAADLIVSADVVLADGSLVRCSQSRNPDLLWALRGGGGGNFGIVTRFQMRPVDIPQMVNFGLTWPWDAAAEVLLGWQQWVAESSPAIGSGPAVVLPDAAPGKVPQVSVAGAGLATAAEVETELDALVAAVGRPPLTRTAQTFSRRDGMLQWFRCTNLTTSQCHRVGTTPDGVLPRFDFTLDRSRLFSATVPGSGVAEILSAFDADRVAGQARFLRGIALGGRANQVSRTETAYVHRDSLFTLNFALGLAGATPDPDVIAAGRAWVNRGFETMNRYSNGESYQNFIDPALADWRRSYYAENYARLVRVKQHYDPHGFFRFAQGVGS